MRPLTSLILASLFSVLGASEPPPKTQLYEKEMAALAVEGWFTMLGTWDKEGRPIVMDLSFTHKCDLDAMKLEFRSPHRVKLTQADGVIKDQGATVTQNSSGGGRQWFVHCALSQCCGGSPFTEYKIITEGAKDLPGQLKFNSAGSPHLKLWEEAGDRIRWAVTEAWQVKVEATINDGESWTLLGAENSGQYDLKPLLPQEPVLRITAFRGLRCYAEAYIPSKGFLADPHPYLQPTYMVGTARKQGGMSVWPYFAFKPELDPPKGYQGRVKVHLNFKRLPFDPEKLFPGKYVQKVFQAEWSEPSTGASPSLMMQASLVRDPKRWKGGWLYRIKPDGKGGWEKDDPIMPVGPADQPLNNPGYPNNIFISGRITYEEKITKYLQHPLEVNFSYYFILVGD